MRLCLSFFLIVLSIHSFAQFKNLKLDEQTETKGMSEPSVAINHKDPNNIVIANFIKHFA
jgi:hypothetical protein